MAARTLHAELDAAVLGAYGFSTDDDLLTQLFALNPRTSRPNPSTRDDLGQCRRSRSRPR